MRKFSFLAAFAFLSMFSFAQVKQSESLLHSVKVLKSVNNVVPDAKSTVVDSIHYDGNNADGIGTDDVASTIGAYAFFSQQYTSAHRAAGNTITSVKLYLNGVSDVTAAHLNIYSDKGGATIATQSFAPIEGWNEVVLNAPLAIPATDLFIGYEVATTGGFPVGCDAGDVLPDSNANWIVVDGIWGHLSDFGPSFSGRWNIRAMISGVALTDPSAFCNIEAWSAGEVSLGKSVTSPVFTLKNIGAGTLTVAGITGLSSPYTTTLIPEGVGLANGESVQFAFNFAPVSAGISSQTVVIATNAGDLTIHLAGNGVECSPLALPYTEGFEASTACIDLLDANLDSYTWHYLDSQDRAHGGSKYANYSYNVGGETAADDWMILPGLNLQSGVSYKVDFWCKVFDIQAPESFQVSVGSLATPASLTNIVLDLPLLTDTVWTRKTAAFTAPATGVYYVGFHCYSQPDEWRLGIDDIAIDVSNGVAGNAQEVVSLFPNPAKDKLYISSTKIKGVEIYNLTGKNVILSGSQNVINISDLAQGCYLVKVITENGVATKKIHVVR